MSVSMVGARICSAANKDVVTAVGYKALLRALLIVAPVSECVSAASILMSLTWWAGHCPVRVRPLCVATSRPMKG